MSESGLDRVLNSIDTKLVRIDAALDETEQHLEQATENLRQAAEASRMARNGMAVAVVIVLALWVGAQLATFIPALWEAKRMLPLSLVVTTVLALAVGIVAMVLKLREPRS